MEQRLEKRDQQSRGVSISSMFLVSIWILTLNGANILDFRESATLLEVGAKAETFWRLATRVSCTAMVPSMTVVIEDMATRSPGALIFSRSRWEKNVGDAKSSEFSVERSGRDEAVWH